MREFKEFVKEDYVLINVLFSGGGGFINKMPFESAQSILKEFRYYTKWKYLSEENKSISVIPQINQFVYNKNLDELVFVFDFEKIAAIQIVNVPEPGIN